MDTRMSPFLDASIHRNGLDAVITQHEAVLRSLQHCMAERLTDPKPHYPLDWYEHWQQQIHETQKILTYLRQKKEHI